MRWFFRLADSQFLTRVGNVQTATRIALWIALCVAALAVGIVQAVENIAPVWLALIGVGLFGLLFEGLLVAGQRRRKRRRAPLPLKRLAAKLTESDLLKDEMDYIDPDRVDAAWDKVEDWANAAHDLIHAHSPSLASRFMSDVGLPLDLHCVEPPVPDAEYVRCYLRARREQLVGIIKELESRADRPARVRAALPPDPETIARRRGQALPLHTRLATAGLPGDTHLYRPDPAEIERNRVLLEEIELRKAVEALAGDLREFLQERRRVLNTAVPTPQDAPDPDEEVDPKTRDELVDEMVADAGYAQAEFQMRWRLNGEMVEQYRAEYDGRVFDVLDRLRKAGHITQEEANSFTYVRDAQEVGRIGEITRFLEEWARKLRRGR